MVAGGLKPPIAFDPSLFSRHNGAVADDEPPTDSLMSDVAASPGDTGDDAAFVARYVPADVLARYEVFSYRNAALILSEAHRQEFGELMDALRGFRLTRAIIAKPGGSESDIPKAFSTLLRPHG